MKAISECVLLLLAVVLPGSGIAGPPLYFSAGFGLTESRDLSMFRDFKDAADRDPNSRIVFSADARVDAGPKFLVGYRLHKNVALEVAWADLFGKLGAFLWDGDYTIDFTDNSGGADPSGSRDGVSLLLGLGADIGLTSHWGIRGEFEFYEGIDYKVNLTTLEGDASVFAVTLGIIYEI